MNFHQEHSYCPVCGSDKVRKSISVASVPVFCNVLLQTEDEAKAMPKGDIDLAICQQCSHVFNQAFDASLMEYSGDYDCSLYASGCFQAYAEELASNLVEKHQLYDKTIVEIACGKGDFLSRLCQIGGSKGVGFDPSYEEGRLDENTINNITFIRDYYSDKYGDLGADFICCRHALEHIETPTEFLKSVRNAIGERSEAVVFFEVPSVMYTLRDMGIWDLIYEHCGYFSQQSLSKAFQDSGFATTNLNTVYGNQYLTIEAQPIMSTNEQTPPVKVEVQENVFNFAAMFPSLYSEKIGEWKVKLDEFKSAEKRVVVWGAGSKGVTFLNVLNALEHVDYIVDLSPHKQGKYVPGTGHQVVAPEFLREYRPDVVIVMNPVYVAEIKETLKHLNVNAEVIEG